MWLAQKHFAESLVRNAPETPMFEIDCLSTFSCEFEPTPGNVRTRLSSCSENTKQLVFELILIIFVKFLNVTTLIFDADWLSTSIGAFGPAYADFRTRCA